MGTVELITNPLFTSKKKAVVSIFRSLINLSEQGPFQEIKDETNGRLGEEGICMYVCMHVCISETKNQKEWQKSLRANESGWRNF